MSDMTPEELSPTPEQPTASPKELKQQRQITLVLAGILTVFIVFTLVSVYFLLQPTTNTEKISDVFIIFLALESMILLLVMVILIYQLSVLINLLQNEIRPIMDSTNETVSTMRGTVTFLSENLSEPVIKLNEYLAGITQLYALLRIARKSKKPQKKSNSQGE